MAPPNNDDAEFFPSIASVATETDLLPEDGGDNSGNANEEAADDRPIQEVDSLCMSCGEQGRTRMLLTSIPFFREVIVMSFRCEACGNENNEIQSAGTIRDQGTFYTVKALAREDLNRQLIKSETCTVVIPEYELTIPPRRGQLTTVEGLLRDTIGDLAVDQPLRRIQDEAAYTKIQDLLDAFELILGDDILSTTENGPATDIIERHPDAPFPAFTVQLDDPAGNSFIEFHQSMSDPKWNMRQYTRTKEQSSALGLTQNEDNRIDSGVKTVDDRQVQKDVGALLDEVDAEEVFVFPGKCSSCGLPLDTRMKKVTIPYFKDVLIMSTNCDNCGYRDNEVKSGSAISVKGKRISLKVEDADDLSRDILKSETCGLQIPDIDLVLHPGTLGGRFTTVEGILEQIYEELSEKVFTDSVKSDNAFVDFLTKLKRVKTAEVPFTLILDDPLANSYLQNLYAPDPDPNMEIVMYDRTWQQNEELGLNDMVVEGYENGQETNSQKKGTHESGEDDTQIHDAVSNG